MGNALQKAHKFAEEVERQMDAAVSDDSPASSKSGRSALSPPSTQEQVALQPAAAEPAVAPRLELIEPTPTQSETEERLPDAAEVQRVESSGEGDEPCEGDINVAEDSEQTAVQSAPSSAVSSELGLQSTSGSIEATTPDIESEASSAQAAVIPVPSSQGSQAPPSSAPLSAPMVDPSHLEQRVQVLEQQLRDQEAHYKALLAAYDENGPSTISSATAEGSVHDELNQLQTVLKRREESLLAAQAQIAESENGRAALQQECDALRQQLNRSTTPVASPKELERLRQELQDKDARLQAFEDEGRALALKQSEMEKAVRKAYGEVREKDAEIKRLQTLCDETSSTVEDLNAKIRGLETNLQAVGKALKESQVAAQQSAERLAKADAELNARASELASARKIAEAAISDSTQNKRTMHELQAQVEMLKQQLGEGENRVQQTASTIKETEQREAVLRATNQQLQDSLQRHMAEAHAREERLHQELNDMRKRWQTAISRTETIASEVGTATGPLLQQLTALQETYRTKSEQWQTIEAELMERALRAERQHDHSSSALAELQQDHALVSKEFARTKQELTALQVEFQGQQQQLHQSETSKQSLRAEVERLQQELEQALDRERRLQADLRSKDSQMKLEIEELQATIDFNKTQFEAKITRLQEAIAESDRRNARHVDRSAGNAHNQHVVPKSRSDRMLLQRASETPTGLQTGEVSFVMLDRVQQALHVREEEVISLRTQLEEACNGRQALADELSQLAGKYQELEDSMHDTAELRAELEHLQTERDTLLELLGEKTEEVECMKADLQEVKLMYQTQIAELMDKVAPQN